MSRRFVAIPIAGVVAVALAAVVAVAVASGGSSGAIRREPAAAVVDDLLTRWEGWRRATLSYVETTTRRSDTATLTQEVRVAQRFPDVVVRDGDDVSARIGGRLLGCRPVGDREECVDNGGFRPEDELRLELDDLRASVSGPSATYRAERLGGSCFQLRHTGSDPFPAYGDLERWCFDDETGAVVSEERRADGLTTTIVRSDLTIDVDPATFDLAATPPG